MRNKLLHYILISFQQAYFVQLEV